MNWWVFVKCEPKSSQLKKNKDLNYFSLCALNLFNTRVSQFKLNYWNKWTFPRHSNLLRCHCTHSVEAASRFKSRVLDVISLSDGSMQQRKSSSFEWIYEAVSLCIHTALEHQWSVFLDSTMNGHWLTHQHGTSWEWERFGLTHHLHRRSFQ